MLQLTDFIPGTAAECRGLLKTLAENSGGVSLTDRHGRRENLTADDVKTLTGLIENQIGEKAPVEIPDEPMARDKRLKSTKKHNPTSTKE